MHRSVEAPRAQSRLARSGTTNRNRSRKLEKPGLGRKTSIPEPSSLFLTKRLTPNPHPKALKACGKLPRTGRRAPGWDAACRG